MRFAQFPPTKTSDFEPSFSNKVLSRAREIVAEELVDLLERSPTHLSAKVQGSEMRPYSVQISADGDYECSCPSDVQPCKHVAAVLLYVVQNKEETGFDLSAHLQKLDPIQAKTLLLDLANQSEVRALLLKRVLIKTSTIRKGAIKALKKVLDQEKNIEYEGELGEAAFKELGALPAKERKDEAWEIYELLDGYEPNYEYYDSYDEGGDAYWEDRQSEWQGIALRHWGTAEAELGRGEAALKTILDELDGDEEMWKAAVETAKLTKGGVERLETWLKQQNPKNNWSLERFRRDFLKTFREPKDYEKHLRSRLKNSEDFCELMQHLLEQKREEEALDIAAKGVRQALTKNPAQEDFDDDIGDDFEDGFDDDLEGDFDNEPVGMGYYPYGSNSSATDEMLSLLRQRRPGFEWEQAAFTLQPSLTQYRVLKAMKEFAKARTKLLETSMPNSLKFDLLLDDDDKGALDDLLKRHPSPGHALKVKHLFPERCRNIFKKAALEVIEKGSREYYKEGARWAEEYRQLEDKERFKKWLSALLEENKRRPALQDEFKALKAKIR